MYHRIIGEQVTSQLNDEELFQLIEKKVGRLAAGRELLFAGFEGEAVARQRSFGDRWHTFAMPHDVAKASFNRTTPSVIGYALDDVRTKLPAIGVFDAAIVTNVLATPTLSDRYAIESGGYPDPDIFGVQGSSLDIGTIAVYYFEIA